MPCFASRARCRRCFATTALALLLVPLTTLFSITPVAAATDHVTTCATSGAGSLPAIVASALANDSIVFDLDCPAITLTATITIGVNLTIDATVGNRRVVVDGGNVVTVFTINTASVTATLTGLTIQHGASSSGGGIHNNGILTVTSSAVAANFASDVGGGIANYGTLTVTNSTFAANAASDGGGMFNGGTLTVTNSTVSGNRASAVGGGIFNNNAPGMVTATNTLITGNSASVDSPDVRNAITSGGHNLVGKSDGSSGWIASDLIGTIASPLNSLLGALASNGGPTQTFALLAGSPAIAQGDAAVCSNTLGNAPVSGKDQRGVPRSPSYCAIGAFEPTPPPSPMPPARPQGPNLGVPSPQPSPPPPSGPNLGVPAALPPPRP